MAGMVATLWQCHPNATNMEIINAIQQSSSQFTSPDSLLGYGIPNFPLACLILVGIDPCVGLNGDNLIIRNNPFNSTLQLSFYSDYGQKELRSVWWICWKVIYNKSHSVLGLQMNQINIDANFAKGIYVVEVKSEDRVFSKKVVRD
ncbi:MAG: S8 family peptidase [Bacteroidetes bacterium]|nr:S8 family peptidase [Bacteroidota bacterium]